MIMEKIQRTFWINPAHWLKFQKQSLDLSTSSNARIEEFIINEIKYNHKKSKLNMRVDENEIR